MHITLVISSLQPGGAERVLSDLANAWVMHGDIISLITLAAPEERSFYSLDSRIQLIQLAQTTPSNCSFFGRIKHLAKRILILRKTLKNLKPDLVLSFVDVMNVTTLVAGVRLGIPIVVSERTHPRYYGLPLFYKLLRLLVYPLAAKIVSQTSSADDYFSNLPSKKRGVIPNKVLRPKAQKQEENILRPVWQIISVGRLCPYKGFDTLVNAFARLNPQSQNLKLTIYGEGIERENLERLIQQLKMQDNVALPGTTKDIESVLNQADLFVFPSRYEGFPNALCEAMAVGLPVIASNCSGNRDIVQEGVDGRLFPVGDVDQLTMLLQELIQDPYQRLKLSQGALAITGRFSEAAVLRMWNTVFKEVIKQ